MSASNYQPEKGLEEYIAVSVTERQGKPLPEPVTEHYHPAAWPAVSKLAGFKATVLYDPRTDAQKLADAPAGTVKAAEILETPEQYRTRYKELFKEEAPFNMSADTLKITVDRAEAKLAGGGGEGAPDIAKVAQQLGVAPADIPAFIKAVQDAASKRDTPAPDGDEDKLPTSKKEWFALYQKTFPDDATEYDDITEKAIREKLGK
jgi:hypothetical protein